MQRAEKATLTTLDLTLLHIALKIRPQIQRARLQPCPLPQRGTHISLRDHVYILSIFHPLVIWTSIEQLALLPLYRFTLLPLRNVSHRSQQYP